MKYIITGATGHIGNNLVRRLSGEKKALLRKEDNILLKGVNIKKVVGDLFNDDFLNKEIDGDVLIHLAGLIDITNKNKNVYKINFELTKKLANICVFKKIRFIYISSVDALVKPKNGIVEDIVLNPEKMRNHYGKSKALASLYINSLIANGKDMAIVYPSAVIGPNDFKISPIGKVIRNINNNKKIPIIKGNYNFVDVRDVSDCIINLANSKLKDSFLVTGNIMTIEEFIKTICFKLNKKCFIRIPLFLVIFAANFLSLFYLLGNRNPIITRFVIKTVNSNCNYSYEKAKKMLNYKPRKAQKSLIDMIQWYIDNDIKMLNR